MDTWGVTPQATYLSHLALTPLFYICLLFFMYAFLLSILNSYESQGSLVMSYFASHQNQPDLIGKVTKKL